MKAYNILQHFNNFMVKSGIREYCSTICKGKCCTGNCYAQQTNNFNYCHTHLPCVMYYCNDIGDIIHHISRGDSFKLYEYKHSIYNKLYEYLPYKDINLFFTPYSLLDHEIIPEPFPELSENFYEKMSRAMKLVIKKEYKRYDLHMLMWEKKL